MIRFPLIAIKFEHIKYCDGLRWIEPFNTISSREKQQNNIKCRHEMIYTRVPVLMTPSMIKMFQLTSNSYFVTLN